jgi:hypothetical protein
MSCHEDASISSEEKIRVFCVHKPTWREKPIGGDEEQQRCTWRRRRHSPHKLFQL